MDNLNQQTSQTIQTHRRQIAQTAVQRQYELQPEIWEPYGEVGREKSLRDADYHLDYLCQAVIAADPILFVDYVSWLKVLFANLNFPVEVWAVNLECLGQALQVHLPAAQYKLAAQYIELGLNHLPNTLIELPSFIESETPLGSLAQNYLDALLQGERQTASRLIIEAVNQGTAIKDIYLHVFQRTQYEIGRLWQMNRISVAQEHFCTAATQLIMSQLYPHIFTSPRLGRRLVATCVASELHEIGVRMVADFFEMEGWDTYYLGANTPSTSIIRTLDERRADILAISVTITSHVAVVAELIQQVHRSQVGKRVKILVGGYPFNISPELWQYVNADGSATDAQQAIEVANQIISKAAPS
jgi:MerR family transcriptional regulator, light-induced transcriptional regulator